MIIIYRQIDYRKIYYREIYQEDILYEKLFPLPDLLAAPMSFARSPLCWTRYPPKRDCKSKESKDAIKDTFIKQIEYVVVSKIINVL
jgi:hypothetical protein